MNPESLLGALVLLMERKAQGEDVDAAIDNLARMADEGGDHEE